MRIDTVNVKQVFSPDTWHLKTEKLWECPFKILKFSSVALRVRAYECGYILKIKSKFLFRYFL